MNSPENSVCPYHAQSRASRAFTTIHGEPGTSQAGSVWELKLIEESLHLLSSLWHLPLVGFSLKRESERDFSFDLGTVEIGTECARTLR